MKELLKKTIWVAVAAAAMGVAQADPAKPAPEKQLVKLPPPVSVFTMPTNTREGRDPFFPESTRPYEEYAPKKTAGPPEASSFVIKGVSYEHGHEMVIINNHTFAIGDTGDVIVSKEHVRVHLLGIHSNKVYIEANGTRREINIPLK